MRSSGAWPSGSLSVRSSYTQRPPTRFDRSKMVTSWPARRHSQAVTRPAAPAPMTATALPAMRSYGTTRGSADPRDAGVSTRRRGGRIAKISPAATKLATATAINAPS